MQNITYLDNSATTKPCEQSKLSLLNALQEDWGNPSSLHSLGINAENIILDAKKTVSKLLSCRDDQIFFTSGGTEANNIAIMGAAMARRKRGNRIVTTSIEHPSVANLMKALEEKGFEVIYLKPNGDGSVLEKDIYSAVNDKTILVSIMLVNNETGAIQPVKCIADAVKKANAPALIHTDAVQAFGKIPVNPFALGVDLLSASGHKIHAPKGIGILYKKKGVTISPTLFGGGQQSGIRPGTEPVPLIAALDGAVKALPPVQSELENIKDLNSYTKALLEKIPEVKFNSSEDSLPYIINISLPGIRSETLLHFLDSLGIIVSSGSACSKGSLSGVLSEMGMPMNRVDSALRISFSRFNKKEDADRLAEGLNLAINKLKRVK